MKSIAKFCLLFTLTLNHRLIFAQNQDNQKSLSPLNNTDPDHHRNGLPSQQTTYSPTKAQFSNSGFVPIAKPLIAKLPERYESTQSVGNDQQQPDPGLMLTRMGYTNGGDYEAQGYGLTNYNNYPSVSAFSDQSSAPLVRNVKQDPIGSDSSQDPAVQHVYDMGSNARFNEKYNKYIQTGNTGSDDYSGDSQTSSEGNRQNFYKQLSSDSDVNKFLKSSASEANEEMVSADPSSESTDSDSDYPSNGNQNIQDFQLNKGQKPSFPMMGDDQQLLTPELAQQLFKNYAQTQEMSGNSLNDNQLAQSGASENDYQNLLNQLSMSSQTLNYNLPQKTQSELLQEFSAQQLANYGAGSQQLMANMGSQLGSNFNSQATAMGSQLSQQMATNQGLPLNGMQNFSPAPDGSQLPAPPGYKHVGYITIPAGSANVPSMMNTPTGGLPIIRPMPMMSGPQDSNRLPIGMTQKHLHGFQDQSKKTQEKQTSESKPRRTFLSRLNPLNMLRRLRQRRERRQTDLGTNGSKGNDIVRMSSNGIYGMSPMNGFGSVSGLGGMSGLSGMYASMSGPQPVYAGVPGVSSISSFNPAMSPYSGGFSFGGYPSSGFGYMPSMYGQSGSGMKDITQSAASNGVMSSSAMDGSMQMPMMMPYNPMGGYSQMQPMAVPMGSSMGSMGSMPYGMVNQQQTQQSSQQEDTQQENPNQLPGGLNLSDLLKDEEDEEPSRFRRFLSYLNPINLFRRLRDRNATENDDRKRFGRYRRSISDQHLDEKSFVHFPESESIPRASRVMFLKRSGRKSRMRFPRNDDTEDINAFNDTNDKKSNKTDDSIDSADSGPYPLSDHNSDESVSRSRNRYNNRRNRRPNSRALFTTEGRNLGLMGSGNFEVIRGGTFRPEEVPGSTHSDKEDGPVYERESSGNVFSAIEDLDFDSGSPEVLGFQGFNGFGSMYNSLSASNKVPKLATLEERRDLIASIENPTLTTTELKAMS